MRWKFIFNCRKEKISGKNSYAKRVKPTTAIMLYSDPKNFERCFRGESLYAPADFGDDYLIGVNGPMDDDGFGRFLENIDQEIGYISATG